MHMTLSGKGSKCRVCTHPDRMQIESMLARGSGIAAIRPIMGDAFSRRALYRHRAKHMIAADWPASRPVPFPHDGSPVERVKWLQREAEHTAALAERSGNLGAKVKAIHEISRLIWLEQRMNQQAHDDAADSPYREDVESSFGMDCARIDCVTLGSPDFGTTKKLATWCEKATLCR
jgi:hypothetical protein